MDEIKKMRSYLLDAEVLVDNVYHFAMKKGSVADELRSNMNAAGNAINDAYSLLDKLGMSKEDILEKLQMNNGQ